ncbi:kynureninase [Mucilaginibacter phyllosphaerae]|uniref:Kynureninase n=1 Tax=Mucilaginibacter phyllosphaerae TaxID=1812349 RepID=A0A4Y8A737_9SPHI|nr:kynureninase [Mucilaginibacter phyllosphaerae]MBB3970911.1 kynureninase [Mucilaginibacter phyllosphaerae]TEW64155.1 kynureninase [Mucilaginibacter phyllosphaerae]GGH05391.1 kynureninase [Mucilaginibacter phyllosphaerae]
MIYQDNLQFALQLDEQDALRSFRSEFLIPKHNGEDAVYLCGNSLGLQPRSAKKYIQDQLNAWETNAVEGWFTGDEPWLNYHKQLLPALSNLLGAKQTEITVMNSLTVNLHLLMVSFYKPTGKRYKILMEAGAFPSDQYAVESQVRFHGFDPNGAVIEVAPRAGETTLRTEDILKQITDNADELALVLFSGINYYTGQFFDLEAIARAGHAAGAMVGFDLAHAAGNVPLKLHDWGADFACWCSYKYMNSGPGGISGIFVHEKHFTDTSLNRFAGWWGYRRDKQFLMAPGFEPENGAEGWNVSTSPIILMALHRASLDIFERAGGLQALRAKSELLTGYLEYLISEVNKKHGEEVYHIITPADNSRRGCQLSVVCKRKAKEIFNYLAQNGVIGDWREPDVIRLSPVPLYNSYVDVYRASESLFRAI